MPRTPPPMTMALLPVRSVETPCLLITPSGSAIGRGELLRACRLLLMVGGMADAEGVGEGSQEVASYVSGASGWRILHSRWPWPASDTIARIDRKSVVWGKGVSVRVDLGGRGILRKKIERTNAKAWIGSMYN